jgi:3-demethoxyubiquinol 3-hydroxylase
MFKADRIRHLTSTIGSRLPKNGPSRLTRRKFTDSIEIESNSNLSSGIANDGNQSDSLPSASEKCNVESSSPFLADRGRKRVIDRMLRVNHAGEIGARQIYAGQLSVFGGSVVGKVIQHMADQEQKHLDTFNRLIIDRRVRPTALMPLWNVAGYTLGLGTALMGKEAAMACTVAVEEVIAEHYNDQVRTLLQDGWQHEERLRAIFREFRDDELEHKDTGLEHDAENAPLYKGLSAVIKAGCRTAIFITERV